MAGRRRPDFRAQFVNGGYVLHCRRCGTREELSREARVHDAALTHALWFHWSRAKIPPMGMVV